MKRTVIRYKTKPDMADRNAELIAAVFAELKAAQPQGLRYLSLRLEDDPRRSRLTVFFRLLLALPHLVWLVQSDFLPFTYAEHRALPSRGLIDHSRLSNLSFCPPG